MINLYLYSRVGSDRTKAEFQSLLERLCRPEIKLSVNRELVRCFDLSDWEAYDNFDQADIIVTYGGDGTLLEVVHLLEGRDIPVLGINSGRLGFLASVTREQCELVVDALIHKRYEVEERSLIECNYQGRVMIAFNEFTIQRSQGEMISVAVFVDQQIVGRYWGDGVILSTPTGSTAYSLSVGGPIMNPRCRCFILAPICPHNLTMRPIVIPDEGVISFKVESRSDEYLATLDNTVLRLESGESLSVRKSAKSVKMIVSDSASFYETLQSKLMWGVDKRNKN